MLFFIKTSFVISLKMEYYKESNTKHFIIKPNVVIPTKEESHKETSVKFHNFNEGNAYVKKEFKK